MDKIIIAPNKYVQVSGELVNLGKYVCSLGKKALCLVTESGLKRVKDTVDYSIN